ncbi:MAG: glycosyltransferase [Deltaproteobacteria bacterium]|nr:glycosyltransferase [Deltaproteobacteria bacterium]
MVVPVYNGAAFIEASIRELDRCFADRPGGVELILIDDGSRDATHDALCRAVAVARLPVRVLRHARNRGKGAAVASGVAAARGATIVFTDADLAYPPGQVDAIEAALDAGADVAIASRVHRESRYVIRPSFFRYLYTRHLAGRLFNWLVRLLLLPGLHDTQAGFKGFRAETAARLFAAPLPRGFGFDLGLLFRARRLGLRIGEIGVWYRYDSEPTTVRFALDTLGVLRDLARLRLASLGRMPSGDALGERLARAVPPAALAVVLALSLTGLVLARLTGSDGRLALAAWLLALLGLALGARRATPVRPRLRWFRSPAEAGLFALILGLAAVLRLARLDALPPMVHIDSAECGLRGLALLGGSVRDAFDFSPWYHTPYLSFLPYAGSFALAGVSVLGLRLPSALIGTLCLVPLYALARLWFGSRAALLTCALFAVSHAAIHFSRIGLWNIQTLFYVLAAFAALAAAWRRGSPFAASAAGMIAGLACYSYTAGRLAPMVAVAFLALQGLGRRRRLALRLGGWFAAGLFVALLPLALNYAMAPELLFEDRSAEVWVLADENAGHVEATLGTTAPAAVLWEQSRRTLQGFATLGDTSSQYGTGQPLLAPWIALLAALGLGLALRRAGRARYRLLLLWTLLGLVFGSVLILDPPSYTRLIILFPVPYLLAAVALLALLRRARRLSGAWVLAAGAALVLAGGVFNLAGYERFIAQMRQMPREWDVLRVMERSGADLDYYLFTGPFLLADSPIFALFGAHARTVSGFTEQDLPERLARDAIFVLQGDPGGIGTEISDRFPGAEREVVEEDGRRQMVLYRCTREDGCRSTVH